MNNLEKPLEMAKVHKELHNDDKTVCNLRDMRALIEDGARLLRSNIKQIGGSYITEVMYKGYQFIAIHHAPIETKTRIVDYSNN